MSLDNLRKEINIIDEKIINLICQRAEVAKKIAENKSVDDSPLYRPNREQEVYEKVRKLNKTAIDNVSIENIYREIMSATLKLEGSLKVAYLGPVGTFTHQAAVKRFGSSLKLLPANDIDEVFDVVQKKEVRYGVVPLENSIEGIVNATLDSLISYQLTIYAEISISVKHNLITYSDNLEQIKKIHTHRQAYPQCKKWAMKHLPQAKWKETTSTSAAVKAISENKDKTLAAIGSEAAAMTYNVPILSSNISDYQRNFTRFIVVGHDQSQPSKKDRTSIIFTLPDKPGALYTILQPIFDEKINVTSIESRPNRSELWSYIFYIELGGHRTQPNIAALIDKINELATSCRVLGSYPVDTTEI